MNKKRNIMRIFAVYGIVVVLIVLIALFSIISPRFLTSRNVFTVLTQVAVVGIVSVGMTMVLITGGIDLSVGGIIGVAVVMLAKMLFAGMNTIIAVLITLAISTIIGLFNAFCINELNIPPLITTLGMLTTLRGVAFLITGGLPIFGFKSGIAVIGKGSLWVIPVPVIIMIIVFLFGILLLERTKYGRYVYGVGGNEEASRLSGINVKKIKYMVFSLCGLLSGLAGIVLLARINSGTPNAGKGYEMDVITAVVLGGVSIFGGEGRLRFVIIGVVIMGVLTNGMVLINVQEYVQWVVKGLVLIAAVGFDRFVQSRGLRLS